MGNSRWTSLVAVDFNCDAPFHAAGLDRVQSNENPPLSKAIARPASAVDSRGLS
jgi:hypothetical protein